MDYALVLCKKCQFMRVCFCLKIFISMNGSWRFLYFCETIYIISSVTIIVNISLRGPCVCLFDFRRKFKKMGECFLILLMLRKVGDCRLVCSSLVTGKMGYVYSLIYRF